MQVADWGLAPLQDELGRYFMISMSGTPGKRLDGKLQPMSMMHASGIWHLRLSYILRYLPARLPA